MLNNEQMNKDIYVVTGQLPLIILDSKPAVFMSKNGKDTNHTRHISRSMYPIKNGEE